MSLFFFLFFFGVCSGKTNFLALSVHVCRLQYKIHAEAASALAWACSSRDTFYVSRKQCLQSPCTQCTVELEDDTSQVRTIDYSRKL